jgi:hypothetical protein
VSCFEGATTERSPFDKLRAREQLGKKEGKEFFSKFLVLS